MIKFVLPILLLLFVGCGTTTPANKSPIAHILAPSTANTSEQVVLDAIMSTDSDGNIVAYKWTDQAQSDLGSTRKVTWRAPAVAGDYNLTLQVTDDDGATSSTSIMIEVIKQNIKPHADISVTPDISSIMLSQEVVLNASGSYDTDGDITKYLWQDGNTDKIRSWTSHTLGRKTLSLTVTDDKGATDTKTIMIDVFAPGGEFSKVKTLLLQSKAGAVNGARYICVGDSTRAEGEPYFGGTIFREMKNALETYNVSSLLQARANHEAKQFNKESNNTTPISWPTWDKVVSMIPGDGSATIVDVSLGINDLWSAANNYDATVDDIKKDLRESLGKIKGQKVNTLFMLTMPFPKKGASVVGSTAQQQSNTLKTVYQELSDALDIPLVNIQDGVAFDDSMYRDDNVSFHLIPSAQKDVADFIKREILP